MDSPAVWRHDGELFELMRGRLHTAVIGDILDSIGCRRQFLPPDITPLTDGTVLAGRALPVLEADVDSDDDAAAPWGHMLEALDSLRAGEVYVATGSTNPYALWGELMATRARALGAAGVVLNGYVRDSRAIRDMAFPCFARGIYAQDQRGRGRVIAYRTPVEIGGVRVEPGDIVFGDADGVVVVPSRVERDVVTRALEKVTGEHRVREAIEGGMSAAEVFRRFGIL
jgi:4-hydroxy-4-methyl-2-oxoglutarate aldolase